MNHCFICKVSLLFSLWQAQPLHLPLAGTCAGDEQAAALWAVCGELCAISTVTPPPDRSIPRPSNYLWGIFYGMHILS